MFLLKEHIGPPVIADAAENSQEISKVFGKGAHLNSKIRKHAPYSFQENVPRVRFFDA